MGEIFKKSLLIALLAISFTTSVDAQRRGGTSEYNMIGVKLGGSHFNIETDNFTLVPDYGFIGGLSTRGNFYNNWDLQFGISIGNNNVKVQGRQTLASASEDINFSMLNAQLHLLFGYKIIGNQRNMRSDFKLTAELGPVLMVNGKMKYSNDRYETYIIDGTNITAEQIQNISTINGTGVVGLSAGIERFRVFGHYHYGFTNILGKLNDIEGNTEDFKGNVNMFQFGILFYF